MATKSKSNFWSNHKRKIISVIAAIIVSVLAVVLYMYSDKLSPAASSMPDTDIEFNNDDDPPPQKPLAKMSNSPHDPDAIGLGGKDTVTGMGGDLSSDTLEVGESITHSTDPDGIQTEQVPISMTLINLAQNYADIKSGHAHYLSRGKHICVNNKSYKVMAVSNQGATSRVTVSPYWPRNSNSVDFTMGDCPGNPWLPPTQTMESTNTKYMKVAAFHPFHKSHGYDDNFVGINKSDISRVKRGDKVCINSQTFTVERVNPNTSPSVGYVVLDKLMRDRGTKIMVNDNVQIGEC
ncbi:hypothetical protein EXVG_00452 [Emiliania huxleyi virus 202]|nr:hypothetical protein EXVG_00452 [Emiliania huxleyi virus 202]AHA54295.1 putative membrane protein [Emiliania huxleyi virus 18]AHA55344.1 putative membrane protein [Emiliania huxleyi virus 156]